MGQAVFGLLIGNVFAKVVNQFAVGAVGFGHGLAAEGLVFAFVPVPAGELLERSFGMVGLGDNVVVGSFFAQDFAAGLLGNHLNVLMVDVLAAQLFAAVLVGSDAGHDGFGSQGIICFRWRRQAASKRSGIRQSFAIGMPEIMYGLLRRKFNLVWRELAELRSAGRVRTPAPT